MSNGKKKMAVLADMLILGGCAAVATGVGIICTAAGVITAGILAIAVGALICRGNDA